MRIQKLTTLVLFVLSGLSARAHFVWLEKTPSGPAAFFGEWAEQVRETQDGYLKIISQPSAFKADGTPLAVSVQHGQIDIAPSEGDLRLTAHYRPEKGETLVRYHARLGRTDVRPYLGLEIVPISADASTFSVWLEGKPLPQAEITLFSSEGWTRKFKADSHGQVTLLMPWSGQYVLEAAHVAETPGTLDGRSYQNVRHVTTLTFTVSR